MPIMDSEFRPTHESIGGGEKPKSPLEKKLDEVSQRTPRQILSAYENILLADGDVDKSGRVKVVIQVLDEYLIDGTLRVAQEELAKEQSSGFGE